jgi:hypothetical protein
MALTQISTDGIKDGTITGTDLATNVDLVDNQKIRFGTGNDLQIYHDGSDSFLINTTGTLMHKANVHHFRSQTNENMAKFAQNGAVELYYDNSKKFETTSFGAQFTDNVKFDNPDTAGRDVLWAADQDLMRWQNNTKATFGDSDDLQIYHDGSHSRIVDTGTGVLSLQSNDCRIHSVDASKFMAKFVEDGAVELYHNNNKHFETATNGGIFRGTTWTAVDNCKIAFGSGDDLQIYHDGSNSYIDAGGTGDLYIRASDHLRLLDAAGNHFIKCIDLGSGGRVELYHNNNKHFETATNGGIFRGTMWTAVDNCKIAFGSSDDLQIYHDGSNSYIDAGNTGDLYIRALDNLNDVIIRASDDIFLQPDNGDNGVNVIGNGAVELYYDNSRKLATTTNGVKITDNFFGVNVASASGTFGGRNAHLAMGDTDTGIAQNGDGQLEAWANNQEIMNWDTSEVICFKNFEPNSNNSFDIGSNSKRWRVIYTNNTINNSDKNLKNTIANSDLGLSFINKLRPVSYKWKKIEGENLDTKTHYGLIAQEVETALASEGKTLDNFAGVYKPDDYKEDGTGGAMGLTTSELLSPLIKAVQELSAEVAALKAS